MSQAQKLPDFSLMTKEEMESFIKEQMAKASATIEAQRKEHQEQLDKQLKIINNLRQENSAHLKELEITKTDNKKLTDNNNALTTIISNVLTYIRDNQSTYSKYLQDENIPKLDSYNLFAINNYFDKLMPVLLGAIPSFRFHQVNFLFHWSTVSVDWSNTFMNVGANKIKYWRRKIAAFPLIGAKFLNY